MAPHDVDEEILELRREASKTVRLVVTIATTLALLVGGGYIFTWSQSEKVRLELKEDLATANTAVNHRLEKQNEAISKRLDYIIQRLDSMKE